MSQHGSPLQPAAPQSNPQDQCEDSAWWEQFCGCRERLRQSGITFSGRTTQFAFGVNGGIRGPTAPPLKTGDRFAYTGRNEFDLALDLEQAFDRGSGTLLVRLEQWYGEYGNVSLSTGAFAAPVAAAELPPAPNDPGQLFLTNFLWTKSLTDQLTVFAGRRSGLQPAGPGTFGGGDGTDQFVNMAMFDNPALLLGVPYTSLCLGMSSPQDWGEISVFVCDPMDRTLELFPLNDLFSQGVVVGGQVTWRTELWSRPGLRHVGAIWKHVPLTDLAFAEPPPGVYPEPTVPGFPTLNNSGTIYCGFDQYVVQYSEAGRGWGIFGRAALSDGNPTPVWYYLSLGVGGDCPFRGDHQDTFGVGCYYIGASREFGPAPTATYGPRDGAGVEAFYNREVTSWLNLTADIQLLKPEASALADYAVVYGLRVVARF